MANSVKVAFVAMKTIVGPRDAHDEPASLLPAVRYVIDELRSRRYQIVYLADDQEYMRSTILEWLAYHDILSPFGKNTPYVEPLRMLICRAGAFYGLEPHVWKAGIIQTTASTLGATDAVLFDPDGEGIKRAFVAHSSTSFELAVYQQIDAADWPERL